MGSVESTQFHKIKILSEKEMYDKQKIPKINPTHVKEEITIETKIDKLNGNKNRTHQNM